MLNLVIIMDGVQKKLSVPEDSTIEYVYDQVCEMMSITDRDTIFLYYQSALLLTTVEQKVQTVKDYRLGNMATITVALRVTGGGGAQSSEPAPRPSTSATATPLKSNVVTQTREPCSICLDDGPDDYRARMPCGHVICPEDMRTFCATELNNGLYRFKCSTCRQDWAYEHIRQVARFSDEELRQKDKQLNANFLSHGKAMKQCPKCNNYCFRNLDTTWLGPINHVECPVCSKCGRSASFCWSCNGEWRGTSGELCGNEGCDGGDMRISALAKCETKQIGSVIGCPSMRGCEGCGKLITHDGRCKHMTCYACKHSFCFVCLKAAVDGKWLCGEPYGPCPDGVAPRQQFIPG